MKMIFAIVQDEDSSRLIGELMKEGVSVTKLATTGGFLRAGNTTLMIGINDERVPEVLGTIEHMCKSRKQTAPMPVGMEGVTGAMSANMVDITIGGATVFVLDVDKVVKY
jgi:uncharacterized protein YaaQ